MGGCVGDGCRRSDWDRLLVLLVNCNGLCGVSTLVAMDCFILSFAGVPFRAHELLKLFVLYK